MKKKNSLTREPFSGVVRYLEHKLDELKLLKSDPSLIRELTILINFMHSSTMHKLLSCNPEKIKYENVSIPVNTNAIDFCTLNLDEVEQIINDDDSSKKLLATVASERFSLTSGELSKTNKAMLREKLQTLVDNERMHLSIGRVAGEAENK